MLRLIADMMALKDCEFLSCVDVVKSYQNFACSANIGNRGKHEYALHLLQTCNGHIKVCSCMFYVLCKDCVIEAFINYL